MSVLINLKDSLLTKIVILYKVNRVLLSFFCEGHWIIYYLYII